MDCYSVINNTRTIEKSILYKLSWYILFSFEYHNIHCSNPFCFNRRKRSILKEFKIELYNFLNLYFWYLSYNIKNTINGPQNFCFLKFNFVYELVCFLNLNSIYDLVYIWYMLVYQNDQNIWLWLNISDQNLLILVYARYTKKHLVYELIYGFFSYTSGMFNTRG